MSDSTHRSGHLRRGAGHLRRHLVGYVALLVALLLATGAPSWAAGLVGAGDIKKNAVRAKHIKKGAVLSRHIKDGDVRTADLANGAVTSSKLAAGVWGARAYVHVTRDAGDFVVDNQRRKNVVNVTLPTSGNKDRPCLVLPPSIDASTAVAIGTIDAQNTPDSHTASVQHRVDGEVSQGCLGNAIALYLKRNGAGVTDTISFNVMVP